MKKKVLFFVVATALTIVGIVSVVKTSSAEINLGCPDNCIEGSSGCISNGQSYPQYAEKIWKEQLINY